MTPADPAAAPVHAVAMIEQQLFTRAASVPDATNTVAEWIPAGPVALADFPTVLLAGPWLSDEQVSAASEFARFMGKPEQLEVLAKAGFRAEGTTNAANDVVSFPALAAPLPVGDDATRTAVAGAVSPAAGAATTVVLDQGLTGDEGGRPRLTKVAAALSNRIRALPPNAAVGLWTFDGADSRPVVPGGPLSDDLAGQPRSAALTVDAGRPVTDRRRRGLVHHTAPGVFRCARELSPGTTEFGSGDHAGSAHRQNPGRSGSAELHRIRHRPEPAGGDQCDRLRCRPRSFGLGSGNSSFPAAAISRSPVPTPPTWSRRSPGCCPSGVRRHDTNIAPTHDGGQRVGRPLKRQAAVSGERGAPGSERHIGDQ